MNERAEKYEAFLHDLALVVDGDAEALERHADFLVDDDEARDLRHEAVEVVAQVEDAGADYAHPEDFVARLMVAIDDDDGEAADDVDDDQVDSGRTTDPGFAAPDLPRTVELEQTSVDAAAAESEKRGTLFTLVNAREILLRLMHPFIPFITEELWQRCARIMNIDADTIMLRPYPEAVDFDIDESALAEIEWVKAFLLGVRRIRAERDIPPGKKLAVQTRDGSEQEQAWLEHNTTVLTSLGRLQSIHMTESEPADAVTAPAGEMTVFVPLAEIIDPALELDRLSREMSRLEQEQRRIQAKLDNENFVSKAPQAVVNKERDKLAEATSSLEKLREQQSRLEAMAR